MIDSVAEWAPILAGRLDGLVAVVVFGSVARGDFNKWSDIDVLVVADGLPASGRDRLELLMRDSPPRVQPVGWTPAELDTRRIRRDPIAREADTVGVVVHGRLPERHETD